MNSDIPLYDGGRTKAENDTEKRAGKVLKGRQGRLSLQLPLFR